MHPLDWQAFLGEVKNTVISWAQMTTMLAYDKGVIDCGLGALGYICFTPMVTVKTFREGGSNPLVDET